MHIWLTSVVVVEQFLERLLSGTCAADARIFQRIEASSFAPTIVIALWVSLLGFVPLFEMGWSFPQWKTSVFGGYKVFSCSSAQGFFEWSVDHADRNSVARRCYKRCSSVVDCSEVPCWSLLICKDQILLQKEFLKVWILRKVSPARKVVVLLSSR